MKPDDAAQSSLSGLQALFACDRKAALKKLCRDLVIQSDDLSYLIRLGHTAGSDIRHVSIFHQWHPEHLILTEEDHDRIRSNGVGRCRNGGEKVFGKVVEMMRQRRMSAAHLFTVPANPMDWHLFYFNQKDTGGDYFGDGSHHWTGGSHIHLINWLTHPRLDLERELEAFQREGRPAAKGGLHIRYRKQHGTP